METHAKKQMTVICEVPVIGRVTRALDRVGVTGYTVFNAHAGKGTQGEWDEDRMIGDTGRMVMIVSVMSKEDADKATDEIYNVLDPQMGIVTVGDVFVLRPDRF
ncbi:MAG: DUF190 domain-containing protein [Pseudomonadota bacterium]